MGVTFATYALGAAAAGTATFIALAFVTNVAIGLVIGALTKGLSKKPSSSSLASSLVDRMSTVRSPVSAWRVVFGEVRISGTLTFLHSFVSAPTGVVEYSHRHMVLTMAGHEVEEIGDIYFNDELVETITTGNVFYGIGKFTGQVLLQKNLGSPSQAAFSEAMALLPTLWTANHRQRGRAGIYVVTGVDSNVFPGGLPNITAVVKGYNQVYDPRTAATGYSNNPALCVAAYLCNATFGYGVVYATGIDETALIAAANVCDERVDAVWQPTFTADDATDVITLSADNNQISTGEGVKLTTTNTLPAPLVVGTVYYLITTGAATGKLAASYDDALTGTAIDITDTGIGTHSLERCAIFLADAGEDWLVFNQSNKKIFTGDGVRIEGSNVGSPVLAPDLPAPLAINTTYYAIRLDDDTIQLATTYANALAGTAIDITTEGTGVHTARLYDTVRYACNGTFLTSEEPLEIIQKLCSSMAGHAVKVGKTWRIVAGAYVAPSGTLTPTELRGAVDIMPLASWRDSANGVKGVFVSPENHWQATDFPPIEGGPVGSPTITFLEEDGNRRAWKDIELPFTTRTLMAMRIAKIELARSRVPLRMTLPCRLSAYRFQPLDTIQLTWGRYGLASQIFEVLNGKFVVYPDENGSPALGYDLIVQQTSSSIFEWAASEGKELRQPPPTDFPTISILRDLVPRNVGGLEIFEQGSDDEFVGKHCKFAWRRQSLFAPEVGGEAFGAGTEVFDMLEPVYEVKIYTSDGGVIGALRRTEPLQKDTVYTYTYEKNSEDGDGTPAREFVITVYQVTKYGKRSPYPAYLNVSNPAPAVTDFSVVAIDRGFSFTYSCDDTDFDHIAVYASLTSGFTPSASNLVYSGSKRQGSVGPLLGGRRYYYRTIASDVFGAAATSAESSVVTLNEIGRQSVANWKTRVSANLGFLSVAYSPDLEIFVALSLSGAGAAQWSEDGINWTNCTGVPAHAWEAAAWSPALGLFVAVSSAATATDVMTSADGKAWTSQATPSNGFVAVAWADSLGLFVAVGTAVGNQAVMTSANGTAWTLRNTPAAFSGGNGIAWSEELTLLVATESGSDGDVITSSDGTTWATSATLSFTSNYRSVVWSDTLALFAIGGADSAGTTAALVTSPDGTTWTARTVPAADTMFGLAWAHELGLFVGLGYNYPDPSAVFVSNDGINWSQDSTVESAPWVGLAWGAEIGTFVGVRFIASTSSIMTSQFYKE